MQVDNKSYTQRRINKAYKLLNLNKKLNENIIAYKQSIKKSLPTLNIYSAYNNTILSLISPNNKTLFVCSEGVIKTKGMRKSSPFIIYDLGRKVGEKALELGLNKLNIQIKGIGKSRFPAIHGIKSTGIVIYSIKDLTPLPHNGCKLPNKKSK